MIRSADIFLKIDVLSASRQLKGHAMLRKCVGGWIVVCFLSLGLKADDKIHSPQPYQVIQREGFDPKVAPANDAKGLARGWADMSIVWDTGKNSGRDWEARVVP